MVYCHLIKIGNIQYNNFMKSLNAKAMDLFSGLEDYKKYILDNPFHIDLDVKLEDYGNLTTKKIHSPYRSVDKNNKIPSEAELDDLIRLHYLVRSRKVTTILEIGVAAIQAYVFCLLTIIYLNDSFVTCLIK